MRERGRCGSIRWCARSSGCIRRGRGRPPSARSSMQVGPHVQGVDDTSPTATAGRTQANETGTKAAAMASV